MVGVISSCKHSASRRNAGGGRKAARCDISKGVSPVTKSVAGAKHTPMDSSEAGQASPVLLGWWEQERALAL